jgi:glycosyltransferase involved in cell wall biosynthesis
LPVLTSDVHGNDEQVKHNENGWLFAFNNSNDLRSRIEYLAANLAKISAAKGRIPTVRSFAVVAGEYENMYRTILDHQPVSNF